VHVLIFFEICAPEKLKFMKFSQISLFNKKLAKFIQRVSAMTLFFLILSVSASVFAQPNAAAEIDLSKATIVSPPT
jgi:hypothetical protein